MANLLNTFDAQTAAGDQRRADGEKGTEGRVSTYCEEMGEKGNVDGMMRASVPAGERWTEIHWSSNVYVTDIVPPFCVAVNARLMRYVKPVYLVWCCVLCSNTHMKAT